MNASPFSFSSFFASSFLSLCPATLSSHFLLFNSTLSLVLLPLMTDTITPATGDTTAAAATTATPTGIALAASSTTVSLTVGTFTMCISEKTFSTSNWPKDLILDISKDNWHQWSTRICVGAKCQGFRMYLEGLNFHLVTITPAEEETFLLPHCFHTLCFASACPSLYPFCLFCLHTLRRSTVHFTCLPHTHTLSLSALLYCTLHTCIHSHVPLEEVCHESIESHD